MRRLALITALAALIVPAAALASKPPHPSTPAAPTVSYILHGTLSAYTAASGNTNGMVTITLTAANHQAKAIAKGASLTFPVSSKTKIVLHAGATTITNGDRGVVKVRGPKNLNATTALAYVAQQVIDQGTK